jgi:hypothetical protein
VISKPASTRAASRRVAAQAHERICAGRQAVEKRVIGHGARGPDASPFV